MKQENKKTRKQESPEHQEFEEYIIKNIIKELTLNIKNLICIYLFGSILTKYFNKDSDIDIAFLSSIEISKIETFELSQNLGYVLKRDVDLINLSVCAKKTLILPMEILKKNKLIYNHDNKQRLIFEDLIFCQYIRLQDFRENLIKNL